MPFPVAKLVYMAVKQISKPIARSIKNKATKSPFLRNYILLPPAQLYHTLESKIRMNILGIGRSAQSRKMNEASAIELASEMLGETFVFSVAAMTLYMEYRRQATKETVKEDLLYERISELESNIGLLQTKLESLRSTDDDDSLITRTEFNCLKASVAVLEVNDHMNPQAIKFLGLNITSWLKK